MIDRRTMLARAGAVVAGLVGALALPSVAAAATGDFVHAGWIADASGSDAGVYGRNLTASVGGPGIVGDSQAYYGVEGFSYAGGDAGVYGMSYGGLGTGVLGEGALAGVWGRSNAGQGVRGQTGATGASGVYGQNYAASGEGVFGDSTSGTGTGVRARATNAGTALAVEGKATFSRSGAVSVGKNKSYVTITVPSGLASSAQFLATVQGNAGSGVGVAYATRTAATTFRVYFTKKTTKAAKVGWMVLG